MKKDENLTEWLTEAAFNANIYDYGKYPVKGCGIWLPNGFEIRDKVLRIIRELLYSTGHKEVLLPLLIPKDMLEKEAKHIAGFLDQVYWVTKGGDKQLEIELSLRPTSETPMTYYFKDVIISYRDLPLKVFQIVSIFRYETKATHPLIRVREVTTFKEAFTFHSSKEEAEEQMNEAFKIYSEFFKILGIPYIAVERPAWDRFPGADKSIAFDTILPDGKSLQIGSIHNLGQNFSKVFDAKFMRKDGSYDFLYQTSYGISERVIASLLIHYGDDIGVVLLPKIAPIQIVIVPIFFEGLEDIILNYSKEIYEILSTANYKVVMDERKDVTPGEKFYYWERQGVPLRLEVGPKEIKENTVRFVTRIGKKWNVKKEDIVKEVKTTLMNLEIELKEKVQKEMNSRIVEINKISEIEEVIRNKKFAKFSICNKESCGTFFEKIQGLKFLGYDVLTNKKGKCIICGEETNILGYAGKSY